MLVIVVCNFLLCIFRPFWMLVQHLRVSSAEWMLYWERFKESIFSCSHFQRFSCPLAFFCTPGLVHALLQSVRYSQYATKQPGFNGHLTIWDGISGHGRDWSDESHFCWIQLMAASAYGDRETQHFYRKSPSTKPCVVKTSVDGPSVNAPVDNPSASQRVSSAEWMLYWERFKESIFSCSHFQRFSCPLAFSFTKHKFSGGFKSVSVRAVQVKL
jgi:hypothetical protein